MCSSNTWEVKHTSETNKFACASFQFLYRRQTSYIYQFRRFLRLLFVIFFIILMLFKVLRSFLIEKLDFTVIDRIYKMNQSQFKFESMSYKMENFSAVLRWMVTNSFTRDFFKIHYSILYIFKISMFPLFSTRFMNVAIGNLLWTLMGSVDILINLWI